MRRKQCNATAGVLLGTGSIMTVLPRLVHACAVCVGSSPEDAGYFWGVLFLMGMPFVVGGLIGGWLLYHYRWRQAGLLASAPAAIVQGPGNYPASTAPASTGLHDGSQAIQA